MSYFQKQDISSIQGAAARLLAAAVIIMCPGVFPIEGREETIGFSYDFVFTKPFSKELFPFLEETVKGFIAKNIPIKTLEMVPKNACDFFRHKKRYYPSFFAKHSKEPLISIFQMEDFVDFTPPSSPDTYPDSTLEIGRVKLDSISKRPPIVFRKNKHEVTRIYGCAFPQQGCLKKPIRIQEEREKKDHRFIAQKLGLFTIHKERASDFHERHTCFWHGRGEEVLYQLSELWRRCYLKRNFELIIGGDLAPYIYENSRFAKLGVYFLNGEVDPILGLYRATDSFTDQAWTFCHESKILDEIIYFLNFAGKIPKLFHLDAELVCTARNKQTLKLFETAVSSLNINARWKESSAENKVYYELKDCFDRRWEGPSIAVEKKKRDLTCLTESIYGTLQNFIALFLESGEKDLSQKKDILNRIKNFNL